MNVVGAFMWVSVGATALHYWQGYMADHDQLVVVRERTVSWQSPSDSSRNGVKIF